MGQVTGNPEWKDYPDESTPVTAQALNNIEDALDGIGRYFGVNDQTGTTYTPVLSDEGKLVTLTNAAAITVTLPQDSDLAFPIGARTDYVVLGEGMVTFVAGTGATIKVADTAVSRKTNSSMTAVKIAADTWLVVGDLV